MASSKSKPFSAELEEPLTKTEKEPFSFWEGKQRELLTSIVDYNLSALHDLVSSGTINLSPSYQRRDRWDESRQSLLIESFLMNVPVPPIFLNEDDYGQYSIIDGRQRLTAIYNFIGGGLALKDLDVFGDINGRKFLQLPPKLQAVIRTRPTLRAVIILRQSDQDVKYEVFRRLNTGGVKLNAQEVRNSAFPSELNTRLIKLSETKGFHELLRIKNKGTSRLYQEMGDVELVLRFFAFREAWHEFSGGITRHLDSFIDDNSGMSQSKLDEATADFLNALETVKILFDTNAFRRWIPDKQKWRNQLLAALYDTQMLACREFSPEQVEPYKEDVVENFKLLFDDDEFQRAISASTPQYFKLRVQVMIKLIKDAIR